MTTALARLYLASPEMKNKKKTPCVFLDFFKRIILLFSLKQLHFRVLPRQTQELIYLWAVTCGSVGKCFHVFPLLVSPPARVTEERNFASSFPPIHHPQIQRKGRQLSFKANDRMTFLVQDGEAELTSEQKPGNARALEAWQPHTNRHLHKTADVRSRQWTSSTPHSPDRLYQDESIQEKEKKKNGRPTKPRSTCLHILMGGYMSPYHAMEAALPPSTERPFMSRGGLHHRRRRRNMKPTTGSCATGSHPSVHRVSMESATRENNDPRLTPTTRKSIPSPLSRRREH